MLDGELFEQSTPIIDKIVKSRTLLTELLKCVLRNLDNCKQIPVKRVILDITQLILNRHLKMLKRKAKNGHIGKTFIGSTKIGKLYNKLEKKT